MDQLSAVYGYGPSQCGIRAIAGSIRAIAGSIRAIAGSRLAID